MDVEQRARELLAAEYRSRHCHLEADSILHGRTFLHDSAIKVIIAALTQPEGFVLVPVEPTEEMDDAGCMALAGSIGGYESACVSKCWTAMLAARPEVKP